jgi:general secretion pathway protein F
MPIYRYNGINKTGKEVKDTINCENEIIAKQKLRTIGVMIVSIKEESSKASKVAINLGGGGVSVNELALMTRQLATLIKARIQIVEALQALGDQVDSEKLKVVLAEVKQMVNEGSSLAGALANHPKIFNNVYINMVEAGEASGTLDIVLLKLADFTEAQVKLKNKIQGAMLYPLIMAGFGFIMMNVIFIFVIPKIAKIFESTKKELPWMTKVCIFISKFLQSYWWLVIIGAVAGWILFRKFINSDMGKPKWHYLTLKSPIIGDIVRMINVSRFCSTLATLLHSGVPILAAMKIVKNLIANVHMKGAIEKSRISISEGGSMANALIESGHFPALVTHMIKLGEKSGEIEPMLKIISENYEDQVDAKLNGLTSILEPIMMVCLGGAVGFIVFSVIIPMMSLNSVK